MIYLIHKAPLKEEGLSEIAFTTVYCTRFTYVDNCLKNSCIQKQRHVDIMLLLYFYCMGFFSVTYIHSFNFLLNLPEIIKFLCFNSSVRR